MHITELDSFKLSDAVKFHRRLNPKIWGRDEHLLPEVREKLQAIADNFREFLGVGDLDVRDITISGSNAAYNYTPYSDIDLHLVVEFPADNEIYQELFNAKKYQYNDEHNLAIGGVPVELYVQNAAEPPVSQGEYSVARNEWIQVPRRKRARVDDTCVRAKVEDLDARIHSAIRSGNAQSMGRLWDKIKAMRQSGLDQHGEFGCENIVFKVLRNKGCIKDLRTARTAAQDRELSLKEQDRPQPRKVWGFSEGHQGQPYSSEDGVAPSTCMFLNEDDTESMVEQFIKDTAQRLGIEHMPKIQLHDDDAWSEQNHSFGRYDPESHELHVNLRNRHIMDILRTTAHELAHCRQHELEQLDDTAGDTGSPVENEAHAVAGIIMRDFADAHPELFGHEAITESSGYIPTWAERNDPRFEMALSVDVHPGQTGHEANKMRLVTDAQGHPQLLRADGKVSLSESLAREFELFEEQDLFEINMGSKNLRREAAKTGAIAGMEFEMIVPGIKSDDPEQEPDYDQDERCRSIEDAVQFFHDGDYNGRRDVERLRERMQQDYEEWLMEKIDEDWNRDPVEAIYQYLVNDVDAADIGEIIGEDLSDADGVSKQQAAQAAEIVNDSELQPYYNDARDFHRDENDGAWDESDWLDATDLDRMSGVEQMYGMNWPYWTDMNSGEIDADQVADEFSQAVGREVRVNTRYHQSGDRPGPNNQFYVVEPDGSLEGDNDGDEGLEFVSPPMPIDELLKDLNAVKAWAERMGVYTNRSTGLHINISVPNYSVDRLDYVKLALLLGDEYVLKQFGRSSNTYTKSALGKVRDRVRSNPDEAQRLLDKMKGQMGELASKAIHSGNTDKYTSINTKSGHIEFRSPGGDWLDDNFDKIENTLLRFTVAMSAALNPEAYREEYQKKLYKLLTQDQKGSDTIRYFADYVAGKIPRAALRSFVKQAQLQRKEKRGETDNQKMWWRVSNPGNSYAMVEVVATSKEEAIEKALSDDGYPSWANTRQSIVAEPVRPYEDTTVPTLNSRPSNPEGNWVIVDRQAPRTPVYRFMASDNNDALTVLRQWSAANPEHDWNASPDAYQQLGQPGQPAAQPAGEFQFELSQTDIENRLGWPDQTGDANYEVVNRNTLQPVYLFIANTDQDAQRKYGEIIQAMGMPGAADNYGYRARGSVQPPIDRQTPQAPVSRPNDPNGRYAIVPRSDPALYGQASGRTPDYQFRFNMGNPAEQAQGRYVLQAWAARNNREAADYMVVDTEQWDRPAEPPVPGSTADLAQQRATPGTFSGAWKVLLPSGEEVYRFSGIGNSQADANRVAANWLRNNGQGVSGEGFSVVPIMTEGLTEGKQFNFGNFAVTLGPHAIDRTIDRKVDPQSVEQILQNINQVRSSIMGQPVGAAFILHDGKSTALGIRRHDNNKLTLATVYPIRPGFTKGKHPTFQVDVDSVAEGRDQYGNFDPPGPETRPTMPRGTVRVDVSDMYDWYKLGKNIANLDRADPADFGKGPPSTIVSFGDEDTEHKYINALKKLGLDTTDIDPVDPNQPAGMPRQKVDPTFNVNEADASDYELHDRPKLDRVLAKCCRMVVKGQQRDPERFGQVAACVIDPDNRMIYGINLPGPNGTRKHAERVAIDKYRKAIGEIPPGSIVVTTCSPCNSPMEERAGESCKDLLNSVGIRKVYAGYQDPTQHDDADADFCVYTTKNDDLWGECQLFAQTFLGKEELAENFQEPVNEILKITPFQMGRSNIDTDNQGIKSANKLPGGSGLLYKINDENFRVTISIYDPQKRGKNPVGRQIGFLTLSPGGWYLPIKSSLRVNMIAVDPQYRAQGIAKAMYGLVLTKMKRTLVAGDSQSPGGRKNWLSLAQIPGVSVKGYVAIDNRLLDSRIDTIMGKLGGEYIGSDLMNRKFFAFDVLPGTNELKPAVVTSLNKIYGGALPTGLYATWSGTVNEQGVAV